MNLELSSSNTFTDDETSSSKYLTVNDVLNKCNVDKMYKDDRGHAWLLCSDFNSLILQNVDNDNFI